MTTQASRLRVTVVQHGGVLGGAERWQLALADATDRLAVSVIGLGDGPTRAEWSARGWPVVRLASESTASRLIRVGTRMPEALRRLRPDVVIAHGVKAALLAAPAARALGIPVVWVRHDGSYNRLTAVIDRLTDGGVSTSDWLAAGRGTRDHAVVNPPRMPGPMPAGAALARLGIHLAPGDLLLGMATRITRNKGIEDAIYALADPAASAWVLAVAGIHDPSEPDEQDRLVKLAAELGVTDRVRFLGEVPDFHAVVTAFDAVAVLTKPSPELTWYREGFGMTALEAITGGVPVIATPPVDDLVGTGGISVPPACPPAVADALAVLADPAFRHQVSAAGERRALAYPDAGQAADQLTDFLARLAHRPGAGAVPAGPPMSVVTTVLDDEQGLTELLTAVVPQLGPDDELVVVDGGSTDDTVLVAQQAAAADPRVTVHVEHGAGISRGRNLGIAVARHEAVACTDAGCVPAPGWLGALRRAFARHPDVDLWTGTYRPVAEKPWELALAAVGYPTVEELGRATPFVRTYGRLFGRSWDPTMPTGRSVAFTRAAWAAAGGFPEHLATGEDVLFGRRVVETGHTAAMVRDAEVTWAQRPTLRANLRMFRRYGEGSGNSLDRRLMGRDLARVAAYGAAAVVAARGGRTARVAAGAGTAAYLSLPVARALKGPRPLAAVSLVPVVAAARDLAKAYGAVSAAARNRGRPT